MKLTPSSLTFSSLAIFLSTTSAHSDSSPTAIKKLSPDSNQKIFPHHLAFSIPIISSLQDQDDASNYTYSPAYAPHSDETEHSVLRRAAEVLALLQRRQSCPTNMKSCFGVGSGVKCCQEGTYCVYVGDVSPGGIACCPDGASCGGGVGECPDGSTSCSADSGGGCCIPGYVCEGLGCMFQSRYY